MSLFVSVYIPYFSAIFLIALFHTKRWLVLFYFITFHLYKILLLCWSFIYRRNLACCQLACFCLQIITFQNYAMSYILKSSYLKKNKSINIKHQSILFEKDNLKHAKSFFFGVFHINLGIFLYTSTPAIMEIIRVSITIPPKNYTPSWWPLDWKDCYVDLLLLLTMLWDILCPQTTMMLIFPYAWKVFEPELLFVKTCNIEL